jgi:hypothetical protein
MIAQVQATGYDWLATGGSYWIIGGAWFLSALFFALTGMRAGKVTGNESDGCLLAICCILLALTGGGIGLYAGLFWVAYPYFIVTSLAGAIVFPAVGSAVLGTKMKRRK